MVETAKPAIRFSIREVEPRDIPRVLALVRELAEYERELEQVVCDESGLSACLFPQTGAAHVFGDVAEIDGEIVGISLWFLNFSTWLGTHGAYVEDLYVTPASRGLGIGGALLATLAQRCVARGWTRLELSVLDWNTPAWDFYESIGSVAMNEWTRHRWQGDSLVRLATRS